MRFKKLRRAVRQELRRAQENSLRRLIRKRLLQRPEEIAGSVTDNNGLLAKMREKREAREAAAKAEHGLFDKFTGRRLDPAQGETDDRADD